MEQEIGLINLVFSWLFHNSIGVLLSIVLFVTSVYTFTTYTILQHFLWVTKMAFEYINKLILRSESVYKKNILRYLSTIKIMISVHLECNVIQ